jgi:hypothetical protein
MSRAERFKTTECKGCGKPIVWGRDRDGKAIPLDPRPPVYLAVEDVRGCQVNRLREAMVSHFVTCPKRDQFSAATKKLHAVATEALRVLTWIHESNLDGEERDKQVLTAIIAALGDALGGKEQKDDAETW